MSPFNTIQVQLKILFVVPHILVLLSERHGYPKGVRDLSLYPETSPHFSYNPMLPDGLEEGALVHYDQHMLYCGGQISASRMAQTGCYTIDPESRNNPMAFPSMNKTRNAFAMVVLTDNRVWALGGVCCDSC